MAQPVDLGDRVYAPDLIEENPYYIKSFLNPDVYKRGTVLMVIPQTTIQTNRVSVQFQNDDQTYPLWLATSTTNDQNVRFYKIQGHIYAPPNRNFLGNRISPLNIEEGRNYYLSTGYGPFERITINRVRPGDVDQDPAVRYIRTKPSNVAPYGHTLGTGPGVDSEEYHKFYKATGHMYKKNAARKLVEPMLAYSARPPGTMGPENEGGRIYKLWERKFQANRGSRRRRSKRRNTRRKN